MADPNGTATQTATIAFTPDTTACWDIVNIIACRGKPNTKRCSIKLFDKYNIIYNTEPLNAPIINRLLLPIFWFAAIFPHNHAIRNLKPKVNGADDIYSFLAPASTEPFCSIIPDHTLHICSLSKSLCPGLRGAFMAFPRQYSEMLVSGMLNINLKTVSLNAEIAAELIESGKADKIVKERIVLAQKRNQIYKTFFPIDDDNITRFFHWLKLSAHLASEEAEMTALQKGIHILGSHRFTMGSPNRSSYVRLSIASPDSEADLSYALRALKEMLDK